MKLPTLVNEINTDWEKAKGLIESNEYQQSVYHLGRMKDLINIVATDVIRELEQTARGIEAKKEHKHQIL